MPDARRRAGCGGGGCKRVTRHEAHTRAPAANTRQFRECRYRKITRNMKLRKRLCPCLNGLRLRVQHAPRIRAMRSENTSPERMPGRRPAGR